MTNPSWRIWAVVLPTTAGVVGLALWKSGALSPPSEDIAQRQEFLSRWESLQPEPLSTCSIETIQTSMSQADWSRAPLSDRLREALIKAVAEFLYHRHAQCDPRRYRQWRQDAGYSLMPRDDFISSHKFGVVWEAVFHEPLPPAKPMDEMFDAFWPVGTSYFGHRDTPDALITAPHAWSIATGPMPLTNRKNRPSLANTVYPNADWIGRGGGTMRGWFQAPVSLEQLAVRGSVQAAEVGVVIQYRNGERRPLGLTFVRDDARFRWWLIIVCSYNIPPDGRIGALEY